MVIINTACSINALEFKTKRLLCILQNYFTFIYLLLFQYLLYKIKIIL